MHWVYAYPVNPLGLILLWHPIAYIGETNRLTRRHHQHMTTSWWRWLTLGLPIAVPVPGRRVGLWVEEGLVRALRVPANREYRNGRGLTPGVVALRLLALVVVLAVAAMVWQATT
jgi:hypothetical protein